MFCEDTSYSDYKLGLAEKRWTSLLLNWINKCASPKYPVTKLNSRSLLKVLAKYSQDINMDEVEKAIMFSEDLESFLKYKYPILRLRYFSEAKDFPKKIYIMSSIILYHCCIKTAGKVDSDICRYLSKTEQEMILRFCEKLADMEVTCNNIETAIKEACEVKPPTPSKIKRQMGDTSSNYAPSKSSMLPTESEISSEYYQKPKLKPNVALNKGDKRSAILNFTSSMTVMPSVVVETSSAPDANDDAFVVWRSADAKPPAPVKIGEPAIQITAEPSVSHERRCQVDCACTRCSITGPCCGDPGRSMDQCWDKADRKNVFTNWKMVLALVVPIVTVLSVAAAAITYGIILNKKTEQTSDALLEFSIEPLTMEQRRFSTLQENTWECKNNLCEKVYIKVTSPLYKSLSRCILLCMGPQLWPLPIGETVFSKNIVTFGTKNLEYKFKIIQSNAVQRYLAEAFKLFLKDLVKLERMEGERNGNNNTVKIKKLRINIDVQTDNDPRLRMDTDEAYTLKIESSNKVVAIDISSASFCGVRHGLETLSQLILLDQSSGNLITLSRILIRDAPSYSYRGLMLDTGRNFIPVLDILRTIDAMATVKLNTFHWRISDATSFPMILQYFPQLSEYGAYNPDMVYTKHDIRAVVNRAAVRGIRVLIEVAAPGPVGRAWSWSNDVSCPRKGNFNCTNMLCLRLEMNDAVFEVLRFIYAEIIDLTKVDDVFHLSNGVFSLVNCKKLLEDREGFLDKALASLKMANRGFLPKMPIVWYSEQLNLEMESKTWDRLGVQFNDLHRSPSEHLLKRYRVIHSSRWDLSCELKKSRCHKYRTWQDMYSWKSWKNIEVFTLEGGEALLWTDLVFSGNLDYHIWPRAAAVAERLWSDMKANSSATDSVYVRLDNQRLRMVLKSIKVQPIWPAWCSFNPGICLQKLHHVMN